MLKEYPHETPLGGFKSEIELTKGIKYTVKATTSMFRDQYC